MEYISIIIWRSLLLFSRFAHPQHKTLANETHRLKRQIEVIQTEYKLVDRARVKSLQVCRLLSSVALLWILLVKYALPVNPHRGFFARMTSAVYYGKHVYTQSGLMYDRSGFNSSTGS